MDEACSKLGVNDRVDPDCQGRLDLIQPGGDGFCVGRDFDVRGDGSESVSVLK